MAVSPTSVIDIADDNDSVYKWTSEYFGKLMRRWPTTRMVYSEEARQEAPLAPDASLNEETDRIKCERWKAKLFENSPVVKFMMEQLEKAGCPLKADHFRCTPCDITRAGGYAPKFGIILCQNRLLSKQHMEDTMTHEMIHAFDNCTAKVNWNDCLHVACSEIRAASLSGDCKFTRELRRGILGFSKHHQTCVKRRAILSLKGLPECCGEGTAEEAVNAVWKSCFNDTAPFDEIY